MAAATGNGPSPVRVGWVGAGVMGAPMCGHLIEAGHQVCVTTRTRRRATGLLDAGATWAESPAEAAAGADVVFTMVGYPEDVREVILGPAGVLAGARPGAVVVDCTTSRPSLAREIAAAAAERGVEAIDAPVSGGDVGAREGRLVVMVGGDPAAVARVRPLLDDFAASVTHFGPAGAGQHAKMANQTAIASTMIGVCEALVYAQAAGLDLEALLSCIGGGAAGSWSLERYGPRILRGDFEPGFKVDHFIKDLGIALEEAARLRLALPGMALARELYVAVGAAGLGERGIHALVAALERLSSRAWSGAAPAHQAAGPAGGAPGRE